MTRKDINKKTRMIHNLLLKKELIPTSDIHKQEQRRKINQSIITACGFESVQEYSLRTRYLKDIKALKDIKNASHKEINQIEKKIINNLNNIFEFQKLSLYSRSIFKEEIKTSIKTLKYPYSKKDSNWSNLFLNAIDSLINNDQEYIGSIKEDKDLELFVQNTIAYTSVGYMFDVDSFIFIHKDSYPNTNIEFLKKLKNSFNISTIDKYLSLLDQNTLNQLKDDFYKQGRVELYSLINRRTNNLYNPDFLFFINTFESCFYHNEQWLNTVENRNLFKRKFIDKYCIYDKI